MTAAWWSFSPPTWTLTASCASHPDPDAWFPLSVPGPTDIYREARDICQACPVKRECLEHALTNREQHGLWGGLTPNQRERLTREPLGA